MGGGVCTLLEVRERGGKNYVRGDEGDNIWDVNKIIIIIIEITLTSKTG